ncbi:MAG: aminotransferase class I/II-fold pyridoxal phosphate-dependent enzyme [Planctomycetes bacterium]|nr:aminotransferase class I/II-fold pyridoxal phosphate-dependent enzyme [Planctomycetota bacterium]
MFIPFEPEYRQRYYQRLEAVFASGFLSEGTQVKEFEQSFARYTGLETAALCNGGAGLTALYEYAGVAGKEVIVPANTFWATTVAAKKAGARIIYADCNREDLCLSFEDVKNRITEQTAAVCVVHIGGHIAFDIEAIAKLCQERGIALIEDCCHAHGATYHGKAAGSWGLGGVYSFYATKTMPLGEGGMVVSSSPEVIDWVKLFRNYGKVVQDGQVSYAMDTGFNFRMGEVTAALGNVQMERMDAILSWKRALAKKFDQLFTHRVCVPEGMESGYYKYIVFDLALNEQTGQVFGKRDLGYNIERNPAVKMLPNTEWLVAHHACAPIWYGWEHAEKSVDELAQILLQDPKERQ